MPALDIIRDSTVGQFINYFSNGRYLPYRDQVPGYVVPSRYLLPSTPSSTASKPTLPAAARLRGDISFSREDTLVGDEESGLKKDAEKPAEVVVVNPYLIDWEENDPDNPRNWSHTKRNFVAGMIMLLTFSIYIGSAIYTSSIPGLMEHFHASLVLATAGLSLFVIGYGVGPMLIAPIQDLPYVGRNPAYMIGIALFVLFQMPILLAPNMATVLIFRFLSGFVGSSALSTGGATMSDIFPLNLLVYAIALWAIGAVSGPILGPIISTYAAAANGWKWPIYELLWISAFAFVVLMFLLPETLGSTILIRRAERLRKLTGNPNLHTQSELDKKEGETWATELKVNFVRVVNLSVEPALLFANTYLGIVYGVFYMWFALTNQFANQFATVYHFNQGAQGLPYIGFLITGVLSFVFYALYQKFHYEPRMNRDPNLAPEARLEIGILAAVIVPVCLFIFGWTARTSVHWIVPIIGASLYVPGVWLLFQSILVYITTAYPKYQSSVLASNDLFRSVIAGVFPLFAEAFFGALGVGPGSSVLGGFSILMIAPMIFLRLYGGKLRARSNWSDM